MVAKDNSYPLLAPAFLIRSCVATTPGRTHAASVMRLLAMSRLLLFGPVAYWVDPSSASAWLPTCPAGHGVANAPFSVASFWKLEPSCRLVPPFSSICQ